MRPRKLPVVLDHGLRERGDSIPSREKDQPVLRRAPALRLSNK